MRYIQTIGRGLRTAEGKDKLIVLDHAGNSLRLGLVTDIEHDHLDDGSRGKVGDGVNQAADLISATASIPSLNFIPLTTFGNWF